MFQIVRSLSIVLIVSAFIGGCFYFLNVSFWPVFGLSVIAQFIFFEIFRKWNSSKVQIEMETILNERMKEFDKIGILGVLNRCLSIRFAIGICACDTNFV